MLGRFANVWSDEFALAKIAGGDATDIESGVYRDTLPSLCTISFVWANR